MKATGNAQNVEISIELKGPSATNAKQIIQIPKKIQEIIKGIFK